MALGCSHVQERNKVLSFPLKHTQMQYVYTSYTCTYAQCLASVPIKDELWPYDSLHTHAHTHAHTPSSNKVKAAPRLPAGLIKAFLKDIITIKEREQLKYRC